MERRLSAILAADIVGYSAQMERDEAGTFARVTERRRDIFEPEIARHQGRIFKLMGDGILAEFGSVVKAVECAVSIQAALEERNRAVPEGEAILVRIGINLGEVIVEGEDRYGEGVNIAARLEQLAEPGGIWVSAKVAREVEKKLAFGFEPMGAQKVKNIAEPIEAFRVKLDGLPAKRLVPVSPKRALPWAAALAAIAVLAAIWFAVPRPAAVPEVSADIPSIAVLPFDNLSDDPKLGYFGDGVAEDIISMLARAPDVSVIARNSSFTYKGKATDVRQIGKELNVGYVLEGSVRKDADKVRIVAQLIDAKTGEHVWAERFDKTGADPWALQDEVTGKIIGALTGEVGQLKRAQYREAWGKDTTSLEEYDYYLRGHEIFLASESPEQLDRSAAIWQEGLRKFPNSALLKVQLGFFHFMRSYWLWSDDTAADYKRAGELAREVAGQENLTPLTRRLSHWLMSFVLSQEGQYTAAVREAEATIALGPYDGWAMHSLSNVLVTAGQLDKALEWANTAQTRDPGNEHRFAFTRGHILTLKGDGEGALAALRKGFQGAEAALLMAINHVRLGRLDDARAEVKRALVIDPEFTQAKWREGYFYSDPSIVEREIADLAKAGLPEK